MQRALEVLAALTTAHTLHAAMEAGNVNSKVKRAASLFAKKAVKPYPVNINTRSKAYAAGLLALVVPAVVIYLVVHALGFTQDALLRYSLVVLVVTELYSLYSFDKYHVAIEKLMKKFKN